MSDVGPTSGETGANWKSVSAIPRFPFKSFSHLQEAVAGRRFSLGVDSLAAARWADAHNTGVKKSLVAALSFLLIAAAIAAIAAALWLKNYWLLAAIPVQAVAFYFSHPSSPASKWVTVLGVASLIVFVDLLLNRLPTAALLVAYAGLTFAVVRAASFINNSAYRKALISDESVFLAAYEDRSCTLRENKTGRVYAYGAFWPEAGE